MFLLIFNNLKIVLIKNPFFYNMFMELKIFNTKGAEAEIFQIVFEFAYFYGLICLQSNIY